MTADQYVKLQRLTDEVVAQIEANDNLEELIRAQGAQLRKLRLYADIIKSQSAIDQISQQIAMYKTDPGRYLSYQAAGRREELMAQLQTLSDRYETLSQILQLAHDCMDAAAEAQLKQEMSEVLDYLRDYQIKSLTDRLERCANALAFRYRANTPVFSVVESCAEAQQDVLDTAVYEDPEVQELAATETGLLKALMFQQHCQTVLDTKNRVAELEREVVGYLRQFQMHEDEFRNYKQVVASKIECLLNSVNYSNILRQPELEECSEAYQHAISRYYQSGAACGQERPVSTVL